MLEQAKTALGTDTIDVIVCNAGVTQSATASLANTAVDEMQAIVETNLLGPLFVARAAVRRNDVAHVVFVGGGGTSGMATPSYATYGCSKSAYPQLVKSLRKEETGGRVSFHLITPGMALTKLLMGGEDCASKDRRTRRIFNVLAETKETMAHWMVEKLQALPRGGSQSSYLSSLNVLWRFARYPLMKNRLVDEDSGALKQ